MPPRYTNSGRRKSKQEMDLHTHVLSQDLPKDRVYFFSDESYYLLTASGVAYRVTKAPTYEPPA